MVVDVIGLQNVSLVKWPDMVFDPVEIFDAICEEPRSVHRIVWEMLLRAGEDHNASVVMDKSLDSVHYADELMALFPQMLFLNVVRDPRAQVASMNRAIIHDFDTTLNAKAWVEAHHRSRTLALRHPDRVLTIRYEDFLSDQEQTLARICAFFGIDYLPQMLDISRSQEARQISQLSALWESNFFAPVVANRDKFKLQLTMQEIAVIETLATDYMAYYGYERMTDAQATINDGAMSASQERSKVGKEHAWREMEHQNHRDFTLRRFRADYLDMVRRRMEHNAVTAQKAAPREVFAA
jgi:hypothetical protein